MGHSIFVYFILIGFFISDSTQSFDSTDSESSDLVSDDSTDYESNDSTESGSIPINKRMKYKIIFPTSRSIRECSCVLTDQLSRTKTFDNLKQCYDALLKESRCRNRGTIREK